MKKLLAALAGAALAAAALATVTMDPGTGTGFVASTSTVLVHASTRSRTSSRTTKCSACFAIDELAITTT